MSKKEIRRAARDAFPKAKKATTAKKGQSAGVYSKRKLGGGTSNTTDRSAVKPPSLRRSLIMGVILGVIYFVVIQWLWRSANATTTVNIAFAAAGAVIFTGVGYLTDRLRYRRYNRNDTSRK